MLFRSVMNVEFILSSAEEPAEVLKHAQQLQLMAATNGMPLEGWRRLAAAML